MKSPWKYLVELASGRAAKQPNIPADAASSKLSAASPAVPEAATSEVGVIDAETSSAPAPFSNLDSTPLDIAAGPIDASGEATEFPTGEPSIVDEPARKKMRPRQSASKKTAGGARKTSDTNIAEVAPLEYAEHRFSIQAPLTFCEEVAALDEDVKQLRRRLAEKLRVQNRQLMKLLERYDP